MDLIAGLVLTTLLLIMSAAMLLYGRNKILPFLLYCRDRILSKNNTQDSREATMDGSQTHIIDLEEPEDDVQLNPISKRVS